MFPFVFPLLPATSSSPSPPFEFELFNRFESASVVDFEGFGFAISTGFTIAFTGSAFGFFTDATTGASLSDSLVTSSSFTTCSFSADFGAGCAISIDSKFSPEPRSAFPKFTSISPPPPPPSKASIFA